MAEFTENFNLEKPAQEDFYNVDVQNRNMDIIDNALMEVANNETTTRIDTNVTDIKDQIGSSSDTEGTESGGSIFAKLNHIIGKFKNQWTDTRAEKLDNLDATISSRASVSDVSLITIKSI
jgi:hypothetical protein